MNGSGNSTIDSTSAFALFPFLYRLSTANVAIVDANRLNWSFFSVFFSKLLCLLVQESFFCVPCLFSSAFFCFLSGPYFLCLPKKSSPPKLRAHHTPTSQQLTNFFFFRIVNISATCCQAEVLHEVLQENTCRPRSIMARSVFTTRLGLVFSLLL